eukprot:3965079-Amphidinium_carterae.1
MPSCRLTDWRVRREQSGRGLEFMSALTEQLCTGKGILVKRGDFFFAMIHFAMGILLAKKPQAKENHLDWKELTPEGLHLNGTVLLWTMDLLCGYMFQH